MESKAKSKVINGLFDYLLIALHTRGSSTSVLLRNVRGFFGGLLGPDPHPDIREWCELRRQGVVPVRASRQGWHSVEGG